MPSMAQVRAVCFKLGEKTEPSRVLKHILEWLSTGCPMLSCSRRAIVIRRVPEEQLVPLSLSLSLSDASSGDSRKKGEKRKRRGGGKGGKVAGIGNPRECIHPCRLHARPSKDFHTTCTRAKKTVDADVEAGGNLRVGGEYR